MKYFLAIACFVLNALDGFFTHYAITYMGAIELNPVIRWAMNGLGVYWLIPKLLLGLLPFFFILKYWNDFLMTKIFGIVIFTLYFLLVSYQVIVMCLIQWLLALMGIFVTWGCGTP